MLATWWVGLISGWVLGRIGFADPSSVSLRGDVLRAFGLILAIAVASGIVGVLLGTLVSRGDVSVWNPWRDSLELTDVRSFVIVAYLHWASYLGGVLGLVVAVVDARRRRPLRQAAGE